MSARGNDVDAAAAAAERRPSRARPGTADLLALVPGVALAPIFLHRIHQPNVAVGPFDVYGADVAIWATVAAAAAAGALYGWHPLARTRALWLPAAALLALLAVSVFWTPLDEPGRRFVTWTKVLEYALLAPALVLLLRTRAQVVGFLVCAAAWSVVASAWGLLQFAGVLAGPEGKRPGDRQESFVGVHDFGALSGAVLAIGLAGIVLREHRRLSLVALVAGAVGCVLAGSVFVYLGVVLAAAATVWLGAREGTLSPRRVLAVAATVIVVAAGVVALRAYDVGGFFSFVGGEATERSDEGVQTGSQRATLAYIGLRIWLDHPLLGVGFGQSTHRYEPYLEDVRRRFPDQTDEAFPSPEHAWGVQNSWVQLLADVGIVGFLLAVATFAVGLGYALRAPPGARYTGAVAAGWVLVAAGSWNAIGLIGGLPMQALAWLGLGLAATVVTVR